MDCYTGAGRFSLLILCVVISWSPSQENPICFLNGIISEIWHNTKKLYESYRMEEHSLPNEADLPVPFGPQLHLSEIRVNISTFLEELKRMENFTMIFHKTFIDEITYVIGNLKYLQRCLSGTNPTPLPVDDLKTVFDKKRFALNTLKRFSQFMTHLHDNRHHFTGKELRCTCLQGTLSTPTNA